MQDKKFDLRLIKAIIGLGNPGQPYSKTRHNMGFRVADEIAQKYEASLNQSDNKEYTQVSLVLDDGSLHSVLLVKPLTFMNKSGEVVPYLQKKGIKSEEILVIHDELERPFGDISIKFGGSAKGHNGLKSIMNFIGQDFWRLRVGIGRPANRDDVSSYVLSPLPKDEELQVTELIDKAINFIF